MFTGASTAHAAIVLIDARAGVVLQTRRHAHISALLGLRHVVACVNKMDLAGWDQDRFPEVEAEFARADRPAGASPTAPSSPSARWRATTWSSGRSARPGTTGPRCWTTCTASTCAGDRRLREAAHAGPVGGAQRGPRPARLHRPDRRRRAARGRRGRGPARRREATRIASLDTLDPTWTWPPAVLSVTVELEDDLDVSRGDVLVSPGARAARRARAGRHHLLDGRGAAEGRPPLRAQAHQPHRPGHRAGGPRAHRPGDAGARGRPCRRWS